MARLTLSLLGPFQVLLDGQPVTHFPTDKERALLAYLAAEADRPHRREALAALLWGGLPEEAALSNLRRSLHRLRRTLGDEDEADTFLTVASRTVQFNLASDHALDTRDFVEHLAQVQAHRHRRAETCNTCRAWREVAAAHYRGDFLQGFALSDSVEFDEWLAVKREQFRLRALDLFEQLAESYAHRADPEHGRSRQYALRQIELEPWREPAHRQLMTALARNGQRASALAQYEACRRALADELGVEPEEETTALYEQIKSGQFKAEAVAPRHNLLAVPTAFVGREPELARLREKLDEADCRLLTLLGTGGVGKTRLALKLAWDHLYDYEDGVYFVSLAALTDPALVAGAIAQALGVSEQGGRQLPEALKAFLREKDLLLILDNFEHLLSAALLVADLLAAAPKLVVLTTSREALRLSGEHLYSVPPLVVPKALAPNPEDLLSYSAIQLFVRRAQAAQPDYALTLAEAEPVWAICRRLDGLPLAIELAAARVSSLSTLEISEKLNTALHLLTEGARDLPARHQTLRNTIAWSYRLLTDSEQRLLRQLAVFYGGCTLEAVEAVGGADSESILNALVAKSLIQTVAAQSGERRYLLLETIHEFALDELTRTGELNQARQGQAAFFKALALAAEPKLVSAEQKQWYIRLDLEHDNLRAALRYLIETDPEAAGLVSMALARFWDTRGHRTEGRRWLDAVLLQQDKLPPPLQARLLNASGLLAWYQNDFATAQTRLEASLAVRQTLGDTFGMATALNNLGMLFFGRGNYEAAHKLYLDSLELYRQSSDPTTSAYALNNLGLALHQMGRDAEAQRRYEESMMIFEQVGNTRLISMILHNLGVAHYFQKQYAAAEPYFERSIKVKEELDDKWGLAVTFTFWANLARAQGDLARARALFTRSLQINPEVGGMDWLTDTLDCLAALAVADGQGEVAARLFGAAESFRAQSQVHLQAANKLEREPSLARARQLLSPAQFEAAYAAGRALTADEALALARSLLSESVASTSH